MSDITTVLMLPYVFVAERAVAESLRIVAVTTSDEDGRPFKIRFISIA